MEGANLSPEPDEPEPEPASAAPVPAPVHVTRPRRAPKRGGLGRSLAELEKRDREVAAAAERYRKVVANIIGPAMSPEARKLVLRDAREAGMKLALWGIFR